MDMSQQTLNSSGTVMLCVQGDYLAAVPVCVWPICCV
jgi:hypothetical protein